MHDLSRSRSSQYQRALSRAKKPLNADVEHRMRGHVHPDEDIAVKPCYDHTAHLLQKLGAIPYKTPHCRFSSLKETLPLKRAQFCINHSNTSTMHPQKTPSRNSPSNPLTETKNPIDGIEISEHFLLLAVLIERSHKTLTAAEPLMRRNYQSYENSKH